MDAVRERSTAAPSEGCWGCTASQQHPTSHPQPFAGQRQPGGRPHLWGAACSPQRRSMPPAHCSTPLLPKAPRCHIERPSPFGNSLGSHLYPKSTAAGLPSPHIPVCVSTDSPTAPARLCTATPALPIGTRSRRRLQPSPKRGPAATRGTAPPQGISLLHFTLGGTLGGSGSASPSHWGTSHPAAGGAAPTRDRGRPRGTPPTPPRQHPSPHSAASPGGSRPVHGSRGGGDLPPASLRGRGGKGKGRGGGGGGTTRPPLCGAQSL